MKSPQALASLVVAASGQSWIWTVENSSSQSASVISHFTVTASLTKTVSPWSGFLTLMSSAVHAMAGAGEPAAQVAVIARVPTSRLPTPNSWTRSPRRGRRPDPPGGTRQKRSSCRRTVPGEHPVVVGTAPHVHPELPRLVIGRVPEVVVPAAAGAVAHAASL